MFVLSKLHSKIFTYVSLVKSLLPSGEICNPELNINNFCAVANHSFGVFLLRLSLLTDNVSIICCNKYMNSHIS